MNREGGRLCRWLLLVVLPVLTSGLLYLWFCPEVLFVGQLSSFFGLRPGESTCFPQTLLTGLMRNYFFDFLWAYAFYGALRLLLNGGKFAPALALGIVLLTGAAMEILQLLGLAPGTCDIWDTAAEGLGGCMGAMLYSIIGRKQRNEKNR